MFIRLSKDKMQEKASTAKPLGKPPPGDKSLGLDPAIRFYLIENSDKSEEGEEAEKSLSFTIKT